MIYWIGEPFLYLSFAFVTGWLVMIGAKETQTLARIPQPLVITALIGVAIFSFLPVLRIILFFANDMGFQLTFESVMFTFAEGKAYWWTLLFVSLLVIVICFGEPVRNKKSWVLSCILMLGLALSLGWTSHLTASYGSTGLISYALHFLAIAFWSGALLTAGWFMPASSWTHFLSWFHPSAIGAMLVIVLSGLYLTNALAPEYLNSFALPYGQALLIKHLLIIPLFIFALMNGFLVKRKLHKNLTFNPKPWAKAEALFILMIYTVTGYMSQQATPNDMSETMSHPPASKLFIWFHPGYENSALQLRWDPMALLYFAIAVGCTITMFFSFQKNKNAYFTVSLGILLVVTLYISVMTAIN